jgi:hypothetical protein
MSNRYENRSKCLPTLSSLAETADDLKEVRKAELRVGDWVFVKTVKSLYRIHVLSNGLYEASGGWFDKKGLSPTKTRIARCTWGGSAVKIDVVAACGLRLEFGNKVKTSSIREIIVFRNAVLN